MVAQQYNEYTSIATNAIDPGVTKVTFQISPERSGPVGRVELVTDAGPNKMQRSI